MEDELNLGTAKIGKLLKVFAIPSVISLLVNALYNIVDQIFIGQGVGTLANGATNIVFPITMICLAVALMFGDGASAYLSLKLGEKKKKEAEKGVTNGIIISIIVSIVLCVICLAFLPQLLNLFGCTDALREYALDYGYVIALGIPFMVVGTALSSIIRADGSPKYSMTSMVVGAIINVVLDAIAVLVLGWGIRGAAIATIIGQIATCIINLWYIKKFKTIQVTKESFKFELTTVGTISKLGISSFIVQIAIVVIISVQNSLFRAYGELSEFGAEIPITVLGIVMKVNQILNSIIIGIAAGAQPIIGYNYGAKKYDRVKQTLKMVLILTFIISAIAFILFQTIPEKIISIFGSGDELYNEFACLTFRIFLALVLVNGIQLVAGIFFQAVGKPVKSAFLTLSRQILFFVPAAIILSKFFNVMGVLYAGPVSDTLAFVISAVLLVVEIKELNKQAENSSSYTLQNETQIEGTNGDNLIITIGREYGSGGRYVGRLLADKLGIKLYDKDLIEIVSNDSGLSATYVEQNEQNIHGNLLSSFNTMYYDNLSNDDNLFIAESKAIKKVAEKGSCIIVGRCSDYILRDNKNVINVFLYSSDENKIKRAVKYYGLNEKNALNEINKINKSREKHYSYYTGRNWRDLSNYDIAINVDTYGVEGTADLLFNFIQKRKIKEETV